MYQIILRHKLIDGRPQICKMLHERLLDFILVYFYYLLVRCLNININCTQCPVQTSSHGFRDHATFIQNTVQYH